MTCPTPIESCSWRQDFVPLRKASKVLARTRHALAIPGQNFLYSRVISLLYRDRSRIGPGHPNQDLFSSPAIYFLGVYESSAGCSSWNDIGIIFVICKQNVGVAHASQLKALSGWASPISHGPSIGPRQCGIQNYNGSMDIGVHGGDPRGTAGFRLPSPSTCSGTPAGTTALYALTACA